MAAVFLAAATLAWRASPWPARPSPLRTAWRWTSPLAKESPSNDNTGDKGNEPDVGEGTGAAALDGVFKKFTTMRTAYQEQVVQAQSAMAEKKITESEIGRRLGVPIAERGAMRRVASLAETQAEQAAAEAEKALARAKTEVDSALKDAAGQAAKDREAAKRAAEAAAEQEAEARRAMADAAAAVAEASLLVHARACSWTSLPLSGRVTWRRGRR